MQQVVASHVAKKLRGNRAHCAVQTGAPGERQGEVYAAPNLIYGRNRVVHEPWSQ